MISPFASASPLPIGGASPAVSSIWVADVRGVGSAVVDEARADMRRIMSAAVVVGIVVIEVARRYRRVESLAAAARPDLYHAATGALARV